MTEELELPDIEDIEAQLEKELDAELDAELGGEIDALEAEQPAQAEAAEADEDLRRYRGLQRYMQMLVDAWFATPKRIAVTCCLVTMCLGVIGWNLSRLSILDELVELEATKYELDAQLNDLEIELATLDVKSLTEAIEAESDRIFQGFPQVAAWAQGLSRVASQRNIQFSYKVRQSHLSPVPDVLEVPMVLTFKPAEDTDGQLFAQTMELIKGILRDHWHIDVISTHAQGDGDTLRSLEVQAQVWVRDRYGFIDPSLIAGNTQNQPTDGFFPDLD